MLFLSEADESHFRNVFHTLGVSSRVEIARAVERAEVDHGPGLSPSRTQHRSRCRHPEARPAHGVAGPGPPSRVRTWSHWPASWRPQARGSHAALSTRSLRAGFLCLVLLTRA